MSRATDDLIIRLARPWGAVSHDRLTSGGVTRRQRERRLANGFLIPLDSAYGVAGYPATWQRQYHACQLSRRGAGVAGLAAGRVHGLDGFNVVRPEIVVPYTRNTRHKLATVHRAIDVPMTLVDGIRVTTVAQTLFDVASRVELSRLERAMDGAIVAKLVTVDDLAATRDRYAASRRPGIDVWRALVDERSEEAWEPPASELEAMLWQAYDQVPGRPEARGQAPPPWWQLADWRFDIFVPEWRHILEADSRRWHTRCRDFDNDRWRDNVAAAHGYTVQRFTWVHLKHRFAEAVDLIAGVGRSVQARRAA